jgi:serine/threonine protein phosphatase 1
MSKTVVIGDIHGGLKALEQLLSKTALTADDTIIFLGDYVDGWSESAQLIDFLMGFQQKHHCIFIKGNHDLWCEDWLSKGIAPEKWLIHGGKATVQSYQGFSDAQILKHLQFFEAMHNFYIDNDNNLFIHAGFTSMHGPAHEHYSTTYSWDRTLWELALAVNSTVSKSEAHYPKRLKLYNEIYIGHTPTTNYGGSIPMHKCNVWNTDTGAAYQGVLTALDIATKEYWQSDPVHLFYPNETGRN